MACNFGWFTSCGDDTCVGMGQECPVDPPKQCDEDIDTDSPDVMWKACCIDGIVGECCCEGLAECNFGFPYTDCGEGTCTDYGDDCKPQF